MLSDMIKTLFTAMLPVLEIRGAIPVGVAAGLDPWLAFAVGVVGNMLPIPILILVTRRVINWLKKHGVLVRFTGWLERKGAEKARTVQQYSFWGLFILVAIPLPGTGAWTGALVASLLDMRLKRALPAITMGVIAAGIIVLLLTYGVISVGTMA